jgi:hypothetical protein
VEVTNIGPQNSDVGDRRVLHCSSRHRLAGYACADAGRFRAPWKLRNKRGLKCVFCKNENSDYNSQHFSDGRTNHRDNTQRQMFLWSRGN